MEEVIKTIDVEKVIRSADSKFIKSLPRFIIRLIEKIVGQKEFNKVIYDNRDKMGAPFINGLLHDWNIEVVLKGEENIPGSGRFVFVSNHPFGGTEALATLSIIDMKFHNVVAPANEMLNIIPNIRPLYVGINVFGKNTKETANKLNEMFDSDKQIMIFPAGEVSRKTKGVISDIKWQKTFVTKAIQTKRDVIPLFVCGNNSRLFYFVARARKFLGIKMYLETMLLPHEMLRRRNTTVTIYAGKPIPFSTFTDDLSHVEWAARVKEITYSLAPAKQ